MKKALLVVSFGTSYHDTCEKNIVACERDLAASCPDRDLFRAFTSGMIIRKLRQRDGIDIDTPLQALQKLAACNAANNFGLMCNQFWIAILSV